MVDASTIATVVGLITGFVASIIFFTQAFKYPADANKLVSPIMELQALGGLTLIIAVLGWFLPAPLTMLVLVVIMVMGIQVSIDAPDESTHNLILTAIFMTIIGIVTKTGSMRYKGLPSGVSLSAGAIFVAVLGFLAILISAMMNFWYAYHQTDKTISYELYGAGILSILSLATIGFFTPLGVLFLLGSGTINIINAISSTGKDDNEARTLEAAAGLLFSGFLLVVGAWHFGVSKELSKIPNYDWLTGTKLGISGLGSYTTQAPVSASVP